MKRSVFDFFWRNRRAASGYRTGVSLHSHTMYSNESLGMVPRYTRKVPFLGARIREQERLYLENKGFPLDWERAFWTPPLNPQQAVQLERAQLQSELGVAGLVSLSDHDNIQAASMLMLIDPNASYPVSVEWTIPFGSTFFHLGVHNLPPQRARSMMDDLAEYTNDPRKARLNELLDALNSNAEVLVALNHPLWDESGAGAAEHNRLLGRLLERHGQWIHALELNGLRSWRENANVVRLSAETNHPIISGGDRHGCEPNASINLTNAATFAEFVEEIRDGISRAIFMPQYREPLKMRVLQTMWDIVRNYNDQPEGRRNWNDRIFFRHPDGSVQPLAKIWKGQGPAIVQQFLRVLRLVEDRRVRFALRRALHDREEFVFEP